MNWVDIVIVVIVALSAFSSLRTGFLRQTLTLMGFIVGIYGALGYHEALARTLSGTIKNATVVTVLAFVLILIAVWVAFAVLAAIAHRILKTLGLAWADHLLGMLVGLLIGLFFAICFLLLFIRVPILGISGAIRQSTLASFIFQVLPHLRRLLPSDLRIFTFV